VYDVISQRRPAALLGGLAWLLSLVYFLVQAVGQAAFTPAYSLLDDRISDLGNTACGPWLTHAYACSPLHAWMNAAFIVTGVLLVLGAVLTWREWPARRLSVAGLVCVILAGLGYIVVGLAPENVAIGLHLLGATNLLTSNLALLLFGLATRRDGTWPGGLALVCATIGFAGLLVGPLLVAMTGHGGGFSERLALYPLIVWVILAGARFRHNGTRGRVMHRATV